jgi:ABC-type sugar transport system permease subunit
MWCIAFSLYFGSFVVFGYTAAAHFVLILAVIITVITFKKAENFKHHDGTLDYERIQAKYEDIW